MPEEAIPAGKIKCYITGKVRRDTPEERVRQLIARSLVEEYGYEKNELELEFAIQMGRARKSADIAIFTDKKKKQHTQENINIIIEVKAEDTKPNDKKLGIAQLSSYVAACPNCSFGLWVGNQRIAYRVLEKKGARSLEQVPDIPRKGERQTPRPTRGQLVAAVNLKQVFRRCHNYIYANQGLQKDKAFEELQKLIFIKVYDEQYSPSIQFYILPDDDISEVRERLLKVFKKVKEKYRYIFAGTEGIELNNMVLAYIVAELQRFSLVQTKTDIKGEAYETIVGPNLRGDRGEFFTPRSVCGMVIEMLFSVVGIENIIAPGGIKILDPAVGTGGFLIAAIHRIKEYYIKKGYNYEQLKDVVRDIANENLFGIDFNPFLVKVAQMNMVMHGDGSSNIVHENSLDVPANWKKDNKYAVKMGEYDIVVTNPPFGAKAVIDDADILEQYELTKFEAASNRNSLPPEQIFIERCLDFLKPGGVLGIVLPDSILSNPGLLWIRKWIIEKTYILASIDLPVETFEPHTGTQTSVLILKKRQNDKRAAADIYEIFMAIPEKVGHDRRGNPLFITMPDGSVSLAENGQPIPDDHLPAVAAIFRDWVKTKGLA